MPTYDVTSQVKFFPKRDTLISQTLKAMNPQAIVERLKKLYGDDLICIIAISEQSEGPYRPSPILPVF